MPAEEAGSPITASAEAVEDSGSESASSDALSDYFVRHKLSSQDTLAGLAVRYNVTVSDIKRANGLLADTAMYAKDTLLIPTRPLPIGPEYSTWAGMIVTHYGRLGLTSDDSMPSEAPLVHFSYTPRSQPGVERLRGYHSTGPSRSQSPQYGSDVDTDRHHLFASDVPGGWATMAQAGQGRGRAQQRQQQVVELMERSGITAVATYIEERLRRRRGESQQQEDDEGGGDGHSAASSSAGGFAMLHRQSLFGGGGGSSSAARPMAQAGRQLQQYGKALLGRLKKAASQPALAAPTGSSMSARQIGAAMVASGPSGSRADRSPPTRQRTQSGIGQKAD